jgi:hypothetical protein
MLPAKLAQDGAVMRLFRDGRPQKQCLRELVRIG